DSPHLSHGAEPGRPRRFGGERRVPERRRRDPRAGHPQPPALPGGVLGLHLPLERRAGRDRAGGRLGLALLPHRARPDARRAADQRRRHLRSLRRRVRGRLQARYGSRAGVGVLRLQDPLPAPTDLDYTVSTFNITYGLLDDLDVNIAIPIVTLDMDLDVSRQDTPRSAVRRATVAAHSANLSDMLMRLKYKFFETTGDFGNAIGAAGLRVRI